MDSVAARWLTCCLRGQLPKFSKNRYQLKADGPDGKAVANDRDPGVSDFARETQPALGSSWVTYVSPLLPTPSWEPHPA